MVACKQDNPAVVTPQRCRSPQTRLPKEHYTCDRRQLMGTYCYLCAYGTKRVPPKSHRLPSGSEAQPTDELASCHGCGVLACSQHGRRVSLFKCALCDGVDVTAAVLNSNAAAAPELNPAPFPEFERTGLAASGRVMQQAIVALEAIRAAQDRIATSFNLDDRAWTEPFQEVSSNNIVLDSTP